MHAEYLAADIDIDDCAVFRLITMTDDNGVVQEICEYF